MENPEYNTARPAIKIREYGRNIHKLIEQARRIEDRKLRTRRAYQIVTYMIMLNPDVKDTPEERQKLWDHLFIMADFDLDVDAPYPVPDKQKLQSKPDKMPYPQSRIRYRYYGKNVEKMIEAALEMQEGEEKQSFVNLIAAYMKHAYKKFNDLKVNDEMITKNLAELSGGNLVPTAIPQLVAQIDPPQKLHQQQKSGKKGGRQHGKGQKKKHRKKL